MTPQIDITLAAIIVVLTVLFVWIYWPREGLICDDCGRGLVEHKIGDDWICGDCLDRRLGRPLPRERV